jgi:hypothetical protein
VSGKAQSRQAHIHKNFSKHKTSTTVKCPLTCDQIKKLVSENNKSGYSDNLIICQIFKETSFIPTAHVVDQYGIKHVGLMQMGQPALTDVNNHMLQKGQPKFTLGQMTDPAKAIQAGTLYLKYLAPGRDLSGTLNRFGTGKGYDASILNCVKCLEEGKLSCEECMKLTHPPKKRKKRPKRGKPQKGGKTTGFA